MYIDRTEQIGRSELALRWVDVVDIFDEPGGWTCLMLIFLVRLLDLCLT